MRSKDLQMIANALEDRLARSYYPEHYIPTAQMQLKMVKEELTARGGQKVEGVDGKD